MYRTIDVENNKCTKMWLENIRQGSYAREDDSEIMNEFKVKSSIFA
jgi:hypothetical protein